MKISGKQIIQTAVVVEFLGRAWQYLFLGTDIREFFWNYRVAGRFVKFFTDLTWSEYLVNPTAEKIINTTETAIGFAFLLAAIGAIYYTKKYATTFIFIGWILLFPLAWSHFVGNTNNLVLLFEFSAQFFAPLFLLALKTHDNISYKMNLALLAVCAITFVCHGLYAANILPLPQGFIRMTVNILPVSNNAAKLFLKIAGYLDFLVAIMLIWKPTRKPALIYMVFWGFVTALARIVAHYYGFNAWRSLNDWTYGFLIRAPHFLLPLAAWITEKRKLRET